MPASTAPTQARGSPWRRLGRSLVARTMLVLAVGLLAVTLALGWMVDRILQDQAQWHRDQRQRQAAVAVTQAVEREIEALRNLATLLAGDTELRNSAYYHLMLEGERFHVQASLERLPRGRRVEAQAVMDTTGQALGRVGRDGLPAAPTPPRRRTRHSSGRQPAPG